jgi:hypothetical protein
MKTINMEYDILQEMIDIAKKHYPSLKIKFKDGVWNVVIKHPNHNSYNWATTKRNEIIFILSGLISGAELKGEK